MSVNPHRGEVAVTLDGHAWAARLTLGALAGLEADLGEGSLIAVIERFESGRFSSRDIIAVLVAGLRGGGWDGDADRLMTADVAGGPVGAARAAAELLARAFHGAA